MPRPEDIMTVGDMFEQAILIERSAKKLYMELSKMFIDQPDASIIFGDLAKDEEHHAFVLENVRNGLSVDELQSPPDPELAKKIASMGGHSVEKMLASIHNLNDAYELAHDLEYSEVNKVFEVLSMKAVPSEERKNFILAQIRQHFGKLEVLAKQFPDKGARICIRAKCEP